MKRLIAPSLVLLCALPFVPGCGCNQGYSVILEARTEDGAPITAASLEVDGRLLTADVRGRIMVSDLTEPKLLSLQAPGYLAEPVPVGEGDGGETVTVTLLSDLGGTRFAYHAAGDVMLGRRYLKAGYPEEWYDSVTPLLIDGDGGDSARWLVSGVAEGFGGAQLKTLNLESGLGSLPEEAAYPGKRWILQSPLEALYALEALQVSAVVLANNHQRDYLDAGLGGSLDALDDAGLPRVGAGRTAEEAAAPLTLEVSGHRVTLLAYTSVDGNFVNDNYPLDEDNPPEDLPESDAWLWEARAWGFAASTGETIPTANRRIGSAWRALTSLEPSLQPADQEALWASAATVYPELQDWVARRGHGGANAWDLERASADIAAAALTSDLVVVNLHAGFQFLHAPGRAMLEAARASIDAGADLVVAHHPHVPQGLEWYKGHLIAYSLGNFIFDQDFLATFPSAFLRTVWSGRSLVQTRLIPLELNAYRPSPVAAKAAERNLRLLWERSLSGTVADRDDDQTVRAYVASPDPASLTPQLTYEHHTARVSVGPPSPVWRSLEVEDEDRVALPTDGLVLASLVPGGGLPGVELGRDLFGWGRFERDVGNDREGGVTHWKVDQPYEQVTSRRPYEGERCLQLSRSAQNTAELLARPVARIPLPAHRFWREGPEGPEPADGEASYEIAFAGRLSGERDLTYVRLELMYFDDLNPTEDPETTTLASLTLPVPQLDGGLWRRYYVAIPEEAMAEDPATGQRPNVLMLYLELRQPSWFDTYWCLDQLEVLEWRPTADQPDVPVAADYVRGLVSDSLSFQFYPFQ